MNSLSATTFCCFCLYSDYEDEVTLVESAVRFIREFELLLKIIIDGRIKTSQEEIASEIPSQKTFRFQLEACDKDGAFTYITLCRGC